MRRVRTTDVQLTLEQVAYAALLARREFVIILHQPLDEMAVATVGRDPAGGRVWLSDEASLLQRRHLVADRGRAQLTLVLARDQVRRHGLGQCDVFLDDVFEDTFSTG